MTSHGRLGPKVRQTGWIGVEGPQGIDVWNERIQDSRLILVQQVRACVAAVLVPTRTTRTRNQIRHVAQTVAHSEAKKRRQWERHPIRLSVKGGCRFLWDADPRPTRHRGRNYVFERASRSKLAGVPVYTVEQNVSKWKTAGCDTARCGNYDEFM